MTMLPTSTPIARLRALGCKVSTTLGHWPKVGENGYSVTLPDGIPTGSQYTLGNATVWCRPLEHRVGVHTTSYGGGPSPERSQYATAAQIDAAAALTKIAEHVESYDRSSSGSRQHFIETGRYLTNADRLEGMVDADPEADGSYTQDDVIGVRFQASEHDDVVRIVDILTGGVRGGSWCVSLDSTLRDIVEYHTAPIGD